MKCNRIAVYGWKSKSGMKNKPKILFSIIALDKINPIGFGNWIMSHREPCGGEIISQVELEYIPYYGGENANVEVRFKCNKCGYEYAGDLGLPYDLDSLNKFLTKIIKEL